MELLILFEQWAGHRLLSEKVTRPHVRAGRPILFPSVPVSEGIEIRHGCQFLSSLIRALAKLPGGLGRFMPCSLGSHMSRLRHVGWNQCSHGLNSRPLESCHHQCLKALCGFLGYPKGSALELLSQLWLCGAALLAAAAASMCFERVVSGVATAAALALFAFLGHLTLFSGFSSKGESEVDESTDAYLCLDGLDMDVSAGFSS